MAPINNNAKTIIPKIIDMNTINQEQVLIIKANFGPSWMAFKVDNNPVRRFTLKKGGTIVLKGQSIRLITGNFKNLIIKKNNQLVTIKGSNKNTASLVFPKELEKKYNTPYFIFNDDGTAKTLN